MVVFLARQALGPSRGVRLVLIVTIPRGRGQQFSEESWKVWSVVRLADYKKIIALHIGMRDRGYTVWICMSHAFHTI